MKTIKIQESLLLLWKKSWIIAITMITLILIVGAISFYVIPPEYETFTTLIIGNPQSYDSKIEYNDLLLSQKLVATYGEIVKSRTIANEVINNLKLNIGYEELKKNIDVTLIENTEIIKINVTDRDPSKSALIANEIATVFKNHINKIMHIDNVQVIDRAEIPSMYVRPNHVINLIISVILGIVLGIFIVLVSIYFDNTIKGAADVEEYFGVPVLGSIPNDTKGKSRKKSKEENLIVSNRGPKYHGSEAFRTLRTNLQFLRPDRKIKSVAITSSQPEEGKSFVASNLAYSIGLTNNKVLLIDADLRKPSIHKFYGLSNNYGLANIFYKNTNYEKLLVSTGIGKLDILLAGLTPPNPSELLSSSKMKEFIATVSELYDIIIIDTPPAGILTDASILSTLVDGVILIGASGQTKIQSLQGTMKLLQGVNANILGAILNKIPIKETKYYNYNYFDA